MESQKNIKETLKRISSYNDICEKFSPGKNLYELLYSEWVSILLEKSIFKSQSDSQSS